MFRGYLLFFLSVCFTIYANAQQEGHRIYEMGEEEIISSTEDDQKELSVALSRYQRDEIPSSVYVITRDEILQNGYRSLVDVLKSVPGFIVSQPGSALEGETFVIRGLHGNYYCKVLINNTPIQPSVTGGMPLAGQLPVRQAKRIEILIGPVAALYGADAVAGVINIVTHDSDRPVYAQADISLGNNRYDYFNVTIGGKAGKNKNILEYQFYGNSESVNDLEIKYDRDYNYNPSNYDSSYSFLNQPNFYGDSSSIEMRNLPASNRLVGLKLKFRGLSFDFMFMSRKAHSSIGINPVLVRYNNPQNFWGEDLSRYRLNYNRKWGKFGSSTQLSYLHYRTNNSSNFGLIRDFGANGSAYVFSASDDLEFEQVFDYALQSKLGFIGGINYKYSGNLPLTNYLEEPFNTDLYESFSEQKHDMGSPFLNFGYNPLVFHNLGLFVQMMINLEKVKIVLGNRLDHHSLFGNTNNPRFGITYIASEKLKLRLNSSTAFRNPSAHYMYSSVAYQQGDKTFYQVVPNTDIKPEEFSYIEAGIKYYFTPKVRFDLAMYYHQLKKQFSRSFYPLDPAVYPDANNPFGLSQAYVNDDQSKAELYGLQLIMLFNDVIPEYDLDINADVSLSKGNEVLPSGLGSIDQYRNMPNFYGQLHLSFRPVGKLYFFLRNVISGKAKRSYFLVPPQVMEQLGYPVDRKAYYTLDIRADYRINDIFSAYAHLNNVFNARYGGLDAYANSGDLFYNPQLGRNFRVGLSFKLE